MEMKRKQSYSRKHGWFAISIICLGMSTLLCFAITSVQYRWQSSQNANKFIQHLYKSVSHAKPVFEQSLSGFIRIDLGTEPHKDVLQASNEVDELLMDAEESPTNERTRQNEKDHLENLNTRDGHGNTSSNGVDDSICREQAAF
ncbi:hypothetical protein O6H91_02G144300 [Diphasiastrum complanatum]|uniref:Uncharacterized protein n=1 Tax=Diphasiastrum complanatum TaxID=34168 RepID=A0ACC2ELX3_DIPCM|nr:hypothetical protein O6H91_02G144300 [Diphasiastrum complanatum]